MDQETKDRSNINKLAATITITLAVALLYAIASALMGSDSKPRGRDGGTAEVAGPAVARDICKQFITKRGYSVSDWGESWNWTAIQHSDGDWSVGARFIGMPPGRGTTNVQVTCVVSQTGEKWTLKSLSSL